VAAFSNGLRIAADLRPKHGDQDEIELVGRKGLVGQHTHLPRHQFHTNNFNRHSHDETISHDHVHSHLSPKGF
jgi:hypothetical protein